MKKWDIPSWAIVGMAAAVVDERHIFHFHHTNHENSYIELCPRVWFMPAWVTWMCNVWNISSSKFSFYYYYARSIYFRVYLGAFVIRSNRTNIFTKLSSPPMFVHQVTLVDAILALCCLLLCEFLCCFLDLVLFLGCIQAAGRADRMYHFLFMYKMHLNNKIHLQTVITKNLALFEIWTSYEVRIFERFIQNSD